MRARGIVAGAVLGGVAAGALGARGVGAQRAAPATHLIVVSGLGGQPEYSDLFHSQAESLVDAALGRWGLPESHVSWLAEAPDRAPDRIKARSTAEALHEEIVAVAGRAGPQDGVLIVLLGHGSGTGDESKINLPGPDLGGEELAGWLDAFPTQTIAVVNTASASGGFVRPLSGPRRIVVTATRSNRERERTFFGSYFVDGLLDNGADTDKDDRVSLLEAFLFASHEVGLRYERDNQLLTEHALLDDNGDGEGSAEPGPTEVDGALASRFFLAATTAAVADAAVDDEELAALLVEKGRLEGEIQTLRTLRDTMDPAVYDAELERLVLELASTNASIREKGGGG